MKTGRDLGMRGALINQSERYGENVEVWGIGDYLELNPTGNFEVLGKLGIRKIVEHLPDGSTEIVAQYVVLCD